MSFADMFALVLFIVCNLIFISIIVTPVIDGYVKALNSKSGVLKFLLYLMMTTLYLTIILFAVVHMSTLPSVLIATITHICYSVALNHIFKQSKFNMVESESNISISCEKYEEKEFCFNGEAHDECVICDLPKDAIKRYRNDSVEYIEIDSAKLPSEAIKVEIRTV